MSRTPIAYRVGDVCALARSLAGQIGALDAIPGHVQLLNMLAKAAGFRNFQHLRASRADGPVLARLEAPELARSPDLADRTQSPEPAGSPDSPGSPDPVDPRRMARLLRHFDAAGRLIRWPGKAGLRASCLWVMWSRLPAGEVMSEPAINRFLEANHTFGDATFLRRQLIDASLATRTRDCREYRRQEQRPPAEALALIARLGQRQQG